MEAMLLWVGAVGCLNIAFTFMVLCVVDRWRGMMHKEFIHRSDQEIALLKTVRDLLVANRDQYAIWAEAARKAEMELVLNRMELQNLKGDDQWH